MAVTSGVSYGWEGLRIGSRKDSFSCLFPFLCAELLGVPLLWTGLSWSVNMHCFQNQPAVTFSIIKVTLFKSSGSHLVGFGENRKINACGQLAAYKPYSQSQ